ncbi:MAG: Asp-tRNA(Asn)/Glu-tRNA(Gln) amidotransferase subunit GatC [Lachnospiraceae bacterium]|nr:Asp-tRNA(Asn)/Glu-tRNA(Gln) amidotransferase subunit GatC [Lachnospiraceae bacterium]
MKVIDDAVIENVSILAKLELSEEEKVQAKRDMEKMLAYIDQLDELNTEEIEPMAHIFPVENVFREDIVTNGDMREMILANAPEEKSGMFVVPQTFA